MKNLIRKAKEKVAEVKSDLDAAGRRIDEDNARRPKPQIKQPSAAEQEQIRRDSETVIRNQQQGLTD